MKCFWWNTAYAALVLSLLLILGKNWILCVEPEIKKEVKVPPWMIIPKYDGDISTLANYVKNEVAHVQPGENTFLAKVAGNHLLEIIDYVINFKQVKTHTTTIY